MVQYNIPKFPSHFDPNKNKKWIQDSIKACWDDFSGISTNSFYKGGKRYADISKYMLGKQDQLIYEKMLDVDLASSEKQWLKVNKKILSMIPKIRRIIIETLQKTEMEMDIHAIDPISVEEKTEYYANNRAKILLRREFEKQGIDKDMIPKPDGMYENEDELDLFVDWGYKPRVAVEAENAVKVIMNNSNFPKLCNKGHESLHDFGFIGYRDYYDQNGDIKISAVDVSTFITSRVSEPDFSDALYMGQVLDVSIADLKSLDVDNEVSEADYRKLYESANYSSIYNAESRENPKDYENFRCKLLDIELVSIDSLVMEKGVDKYGNVTVSRRRSEKEVNKKNEVIKKEYKVIYEGKWVIGTDIFIGCKRQSNLKRSKENLSDVFFSFNCHAPGLNDMETSSLGEYEITIADQMQITWMKYQDAVTRARRAGISIEIGALENIPLGKGGKALTPPEAIDFYEKRNILLYRRLSEDGGGANFKPVEELRNGIGDDAQRYFEQIQNLYLLLQQITGLNDVTDGSTPDPRMAIGIGEQAFASTNNSIGYMKRVHISTYESLIRNGLMIRIQDSAKNGRLSGYVNAIGKGSIDFFKLSPEVSMRELGIVIKEKPSQEKRRMFEEKINIALTQGQITIADASMLENVPNLNLAQGLLEIRVRRKIEMDQKIALQNQEMNAKLQAESNAQAQQAELAKLETEARLKMMAAKEEYALKTALLEKEWGYRLKEKELEVSGRITQNDLITSGRMYASDRQAKTNKEISDNKISHEKEMSEKEEKNAMSEQDS